MARPNPEKKHKKTPVWQYVLIGFVVVAIIVALYYGFFIGAEEYFEEQEEPAIKEQGISEKVSSLSEIANNTVSYTIFTE